MARPRVEAHRLRELIRLRRMGTSARRCVAILRMSPKTERRYRAVLLEAGLLEGPVGALPSLAAIRSAVGAALPRAQGTASSLEPWRVVVEGLMEKGLSAAAVYDRVRLRAHGPLPPFRGSYSAVKRFMRRLKRERGVQPADIAVPIATEPGREAQVDFGYAGRLYDPKSGAARRAWVFVMVLCHSRHMFVKLVFDQRTETWLQLHEEAFREFGGVVETVVPDNTKRAVLRAAFGVEGPCELERSYREFAQAWGFKIDPAPPGEPRKRGKVENAVKYVRNNPLKGRDGEPFDDVQRDLSEWNRLVASRRVHGTTRQRPCDLFALERPELRPIPEALPPRVVWKRAKVHPDAHVTCRSRLFSVPWRLVHEFVWIRACERVVTVYHHDRRVAEHTDTGKRRTTLEEHLPKDRSQLRHRSHEFWSGRARAIGPQTESLVKQVFDQDPVLSQLRSVQAIVKLLERFPRSRAEETSRLALQREALSYADVKRSLTEGHDLMARSSPASPREPVCCACMSRVSSRQVAGVDA